MKYLRQLFLLVALLGVPFILHAQVTSPNQLGVSGGQVTAATQALRSSPDLELTAARKPAHATASTTAISYFNTSLPRLQLVAPTQISPFLILGMGERITLPTESGYVDSITVMLDTITRDSVIVALMADTVILSSGRPFHVPNIFDAPVREYAHAGILASEVHGPTWVTVPFPHVLVPKNFVVLLGPTVDTINQIFTNQFRMIGDRGPTQVLTEENTHSTFAGAININGNLYNYASVLDSVFYDAQSVPIYTNFYLTAHVDLSPLAVRQEGAGAVDIAVYPNPATDHLVISANGRTDVQLISELGTVVYQGRAENSERIDTRMLPAGIYMVVVGQGGTTVSRRVSITH